MSRGGVFLRAILFSLFCSVFRTLLQIMPFPGNVRGHLGAVAQTHSRNFAQSRVRFLWRRGKYAQAYSPLEGGRVLYWPVFQKIKTKRQGGRLGFLFGPCPFFLDKLMNCRHAKSQFKKYRTKRCAICQFASYREIPTMREKRMRTRDMSQLKKKKMNMSKGKIHIA